MLLAGRRRRQCCPSRRGEPIGCDGAGGSHGVEYRGSNRREMTRDTCTPPWRKEYATHSEPFDAINKSAPHHTAPHQPRPGSSPPRRQRFPASARRVFRRHRKRPRTSETTGVETVLSCARLFRAAQLPGGIGSTSAASPQRSTPTGVQNTLWEVFFPVHSSCVRPALKGMGEGLREERERRENRSEKPAWEFAWGHGRQLPRVLAFVNSGETLLFCSSSRCALVRDRS